MRSLVVAAIGLVLLTGVARAQDDHRLRFTVTGLAGQQLVQSTADDVTSKLSGSVIGFEGVMVGNPFMVRLRYGEGRINPKPESTVEARDVVSGEAMFGMRALPWLSLWVGPSARAYTVGESDQRWLVWWGRATARGALIPGRLQTYVELGGVFSGNVGNPAIKAGGRMASGGLEMRFGAMSSFWGRLGYGIESLHAEGLRETVESLTLSVTYGLPQ
jgi:hypothetical protein